MLALCHPDAKLEVGDGTAMAQRFQAPFNQAAIAGIDGFGQEMTALFTWVQTDGRAKRRIHLPDAAIQRPHANPVQREPEQLVPFGLGAPELGDVHHRRDGGLDCARGAVNRRGGDHDASLRATAADQGHLVLAGLAPKAPGALLEDKRPVLGAEERFQIRLRRGKVVDLQHAQRGRIGVRQPVIRGRLKDPDRGVFGERAIQSLARLQRPLGLNARGDILQAQHSETPLGGLHRRGRHQESEFLHARFAAGDERGLNSALRSSIEDRFPGGPV